MIRLVNRPTPKKGDMVTIYNCGKKRFPWYVAQSDLKWVRLKEISVVPDGAPRRIRVYNIKTGEGEWAVTRFFTQIPIGWE